MDCQTKELIAVGASITANCQPCLKYHIGKAREHGADEEAIREAIAVGKTVRSGAAGKMDRLVPAMLGEKSPAGDDTNEAGDCQLA